MILRALLCLVLVVEPGHVKRTVDGDTFVLYNVGVEGEEWVRVLGVDTPERGAPGYREATDSTRAWLTRGSFTLAACSRDRSRRLLGWTYRGTDSLHVHLIRHGLGVRR